VTQRLEVGDGGTGFDFLRIVDLSPGELEATVFNLYQQWLLLARRTAQNLLQVRAHLFVGVSRAVDPDSLNPDPAFQVNPDLDPVRIQGFDDQKVKKKNTAEIFFPFLVGR
jgi:hypothetical protein